LFNGELHDGDILRIQAWDNANNPTTARLKIFKIASSGLKLMNVVNFPNPFRISTDFTFELSGPADVTIDIYTLKGRKVHSIGPRLLSAGFNTITWSGRDAYGQNLANGVYLYRIKAQNETGSITRIEKLAKHE
ncbi:MAG: T9SS type A sorting domain-containing protein, partial [FCB group bacterium]|nr:T9SS type A sorting domain-containing protein [FCB group bacterium]